MFYIVPTVFDLAKYSLNLNTSLNQFQVFFLFWNSWSGICNILDPDSYGYNARLNRKSPALANPDPLFCAGIVRRTRKFTKNSWKSTTSSFRTFSRLKVDQLTFVYNTVYIDDRYCHFSLKLKKYFLLNLSRKFENIIILFYFN